MSVKQSEVEVLKEELNFLTDLLHEHKVREAYYQRPHYNSVPYAHPSIYNKKAVKSSNHNSSSIYKSKYHACRPSFNNHFEDRTSRTFTSTSFVHKPEPVPICPKQNVGYSTKQGALWQRNKIPSSTQILPSTFKIVRTSSNAKVTNTNSETLAITNGAKVVAGATSIPAVKAAPSSEINKNSGRVSEFSNFVKPTSKVSAVSKKDYLQPLEESDMVDKHSKIAKVSYVPCSDCIIEISEYENGELQIRQKKLNSSAQENIEKSAFIGKPHSPVKIPESPWSDAECEENVTKELSETVCATNQYTSEHSYVYQKPVIGSGSYTALLDSSTGTTVSNAVETDIKITNVSSPSQKRSVSSPHKFTKSQQPCERSAKYCKVNTSTSKSQSVVAKHILKNKYSGKKSNVVKCKINKELKGCSPHALKYTRVPQKSLVNYPAKRTSLSHVKNVNKRTTYTSYRCTNSLGQSHIRSVVTKSCFPPSSYAKIVKKAKALHMQSIYKVVNKTNPVASKALKGSNLCKVLREKNPSSLVLRHYDHCSNKKWLKSNDGVRSVAHCSLSVGEHQNPNTAVKSENKEVLPSLLAQKTSLCELKNKTNTSEVISRHSLQGIIQKKSVTKKPSLNPSPKSFSNSHSPIKKAKKVRLSKTAYKVVNRYSNHVSQVVQTIKTKYKTVNKRSASNSHLKWLQEQKKVYSARKLQKPLRSHTKTGWAYHRLSSAGHQTRKHLVLHSKASRKHPLGQNKALKNIRGITYKVSKTQIKKSFTPKRMQKSHFAICNRKNSIIVNVRGNKFQMSPGRKSLKRLGETTKEGNGTPLKRIKIGGFTYVQQKDGSNCLVKFPSATQNVASRMLHRSINVVRAAEAKKTLQKSNVFCMFFNRFGKCNKGGNCPYIHDPSKIAVCTRFLRGTCKTSGCPFSHEVSPGKMAVCSFFLQGNCTNNNCPYQHTSIKPGTKLCKAFVKGYCNKGSECQDAHILACPQFICEGFCEKGLSCIWPHPPVKNNIKKRSDLLEDNKETKGKDVTSDDISEVRYFTYEPGLVSDKCIKLTKSVEENIHINEKTPKVRNKKITFPKQPEFIPLSVSDEEL